jgi:SAM-dependent methyltransferase
LFYEGTYYIPDTDCAFDEIARVLTCGGRLVFVNANPERPDFIPSPLSVHYHTAEEFRAALELRGFEVSVEGAFPVVDGPSRSRFLVWMRKLAHRLGFIPGTLAGRALLKRILVGRLLSVPEEVREGFGRPAPRARIVAGGSSGGFKVLYVTAAHKSE